MPAKPRSTRCSRLRSSAIVVTLTASAVLMALVLVFMLRRRPTMRSTQEVFEPALPRSQPAMWVSCRPSRRRAGLAVAAASFCGLALVALPGLNGISRNALADSSSCQSPSPFASPSVSAPTTTSPPNSSTPSPSARASPSASAAPSSSSSASPSPSPSPAPCAVTFTKRDSDAHSDAVGNGHSFELPDPVAEQHSQPVAHTKPNSVTDANANAVTDSVATPSARSASTRIVGVRRDYSLVRGD